MKGSQQRIDQQSLIRKVTSHVGLDGRSEIRKVHHENEKSGVLGQEVGGGQKKEGREGQ